MYIIQRHNGINWHGDPDGVNYGSYTDFKWALGKLEVWKKEQPNSSWRIILRTITDTTIAQYEPE